MSPSGIQVPAPLLRFDIPVMIAVAAACLPIFFTGHRISRGEGAVLLGYYLAYTLYLVLAASHQAALPFFSAAMLTFAVPITVLTLLVVGVRELRSRR